MNQMNWRLNKLATNIPQSGNTVHHDTLNSLEAYGQLLTASTSRVRGTSTATSLLMSQVFRWNDVNQ